MAQRAPIQQIRPSRIPPHNLDAEQSVLGAMMASKEAIANVVEVLQGEDFYQPAHVEIFEAIMSIFGRGEAPDAVTVADELKRRGTLETIGGKPYILGLLDAYPTASSAARYARIVEEHSRLRRLVDAGNKVQEIGFAIPENVDAAVDEAEEIIYQVADRRLRNDLQVIKPLLNESMEEIEKLYERGESITGTASGFHDLDEITSGFQPSNLIIVAARPSMGKSALMSDFALHAALKGNKPVVLFNLEMSRHELVKRFLASDAKVDAQRLAKGSLQEQDWTRLSASLGRLAEAPIFIDDSANVTLMEIRAKCRRIKQKHGLGLVIIDYLQLMQSPSKSENRQQEVSEISRNLKILARELHVPVICASQLNRGVEYRSDKRPLLGDLRESGCLTADTRILRADTGAEVTMGELYRTGQRNIPVWTLDDDLKMVKGTMTHVFSSGVKKTFLLKMRSGREVKASANHPFLTLDGWRALEELKAGDRLATPRTIGKPLKETKWADEQVILLAHLIGDGSFLKNLPLRYATRSEENLEAVTEAAKFFGVTARWVNDEAARSYQLFLPAPHHCTHGKRNPINVWLDELGLFNKRSHEKFIPEPVFALPERQLALFLRHLWATDGYLGLRPTTTRRAPRIYYASNSRRLAEGVALLLSRFGLRSRLSSTKKAGYRDMHLVDVPSGHEAERFVDLIGAFGRKVVGMHEVKQYLSTVPRGPDGERLPGEVWGWLQVSAIQNDTSLQTLRSRTTVDYRPSWRRWSPPSRETVYELGVALEDEELQQLATAEIIWDEVKEISPLEAEEVFDATVPGSHNFVANGVLAHNSIEQDSDVVMFIYRDEVYNPDSEARGEAELLIAKHRNGPTGVVRLAFMNQYTKFASIARGHSH